MKKLIALIFSLAISMISYAEVTLDDLRSIENLEAQKKYPEALVAYKRFFEESRTSSGMGGVRVSFALSSWAELGEKYPPAKAALFQMSDERKKLLLSGTGSFNVFQEYQAINQYLGKNKETLDTFVETDKKFPEEAKEIYISVKNLLIENKRYDLLKKYAEDPIYDYEGLRYSRENDLSRLRKNPDQMNLEQINENFIQKVKVLIETSEKIGMQDEAKEISTRFNAYMNGNLLRKYH